MKVEKKVISELNKCYSMSELDYKGEHCFLVAAEKQDPCYLFSEDGERLETVWEEPGGVMTMTLVPERNDGQFLATHKFYSPNDSLEAKIVIVTPKSKDNWEVRTLCNAPFVHRFGILRRGGMNYLIVCCLKTGHEYKNDWRFPGACYGAVLPEDLSGYDESHPLKLTKLMGNMLKNHGYSKVNYGGYEAALVGWRKGTKDTIAITWDKDAGNYHVDFIDRNTGCANAMHFKNKQGEDILVATNREIDEIAMYNLSE